MALTQRYLTSLDALRPGVSWMPAHHAVDNASQRIVDGDYSLLFAGEPTTENGLMIIDRSALVTAPWGKAIIQSNLDMIFGDTPMVTSDDAKITSWLQVNMPPLLLQLELAVADMGVTGQATLLSEGGQIRAVSSTYHQEVIDPGDASRRVGDVLAYPYSTDPEQPDVPNRLRVTRIPLRGQATVAEYKFSTGTVGDLLSGPDNVPIEGLYTIRGASLIDGLGPILREVFLRASAASRTINLHQNPALQGPHTSPLSDDDAFDPKSMFLPINEGDPPYSYLQWDSRLQAAQEQARMQLQTLALLTAPGALSLSGQGESGESRKMLLAAAELRTKRTRRAIETALIMAIPVAADAPGTVTISWPELTFTSWIDRADAASKLALAQVVTPEQAAIDLGLRN